MGGKENKSFFMNPDPTSKFMTAPLSHSYHSESGFMII